MTQLVNGPSTRKRGYFSAKRQLMIRTKRNSSWRLEKSLILTAFVTLIYDTSSVHDSACKKHTDMNEWF